jgi:hypothetical protein
LIIFLLNGWFANMAQSIDQNFIRDVLTQWAAVLRAEPMPSQGVKSVLGSLQQSEVCTGVQIWISENQFRVVDKKIAWLGVKDPLLKFCLVQHYCYGQGVRAIASRCLSEFNESYGPSKISRELARAECWLEGSVFETLFDVEVTTEVSITTIRF